LCRTVALLRVPVIASVGHHTDRTLIDDVAAVACSTPTHAAEAAVPIDLNAARAGTAQAARRLHTHARRAVLQRARELAQLSRAPAEHVTRHRRRLHQLLRELRASGRRAHAAARERTRTHHLVLTRTAARAGGPELQRRRAELDRFGLALAAHDPQRTLERGYALVEDAAGQPVTSADAALEARELQIRFHDARVPARTADR
jgi:exodeoxyribonuclease VII large subunit